MTDLSTTYLGLKLKNPLIAGASTLSKKTDAVRRLEDAGAAAVVMYSLFEEQITHESMELNNALNKSSDVSAEAATYFYDIEGYEIGPDPYLDHIVRLKEAVSIPIIASLNGNSLGGWVKYAEKMEKAGADALELNPYYVQADEKIDGKQAEDMQIEVIRAVRATIHIPLAVKLSPYYTSLPGFVNRVVEAGANGLVLFNRFYQPDLDIENMEVVPHLQLSTSADLRLPLRWVAILYGRAQTDLALSGGVHTAEDMVKALMAGANVTQIASELIAKGIPRVSDLLTDIEKWMEKHEYLSVSGMQGSMSQKAVSDPSSFERANYMKALQSYDHRSF
jgi:dihydroorotate dehydrogenase (fumarate)